MTKKEVLNKEYSPCWTCKHGTNAGHKCPWVDRFEPVEGWDAKWVPICEVCDNGERRTIYGYKIKSCPLYEADIRTKISNLTSLDLKGIFGDISQYRPNRIFYEYILRRWFESCLSKLKNVLGKETICRFFHLDSEIENKKDGPKKRGRKSNKPVSFQLEPLHEFLVFDLGMQVVKEQHQLRRDELKALREEGENDGWYYKKVLGESRVCTFLEELFKKKGVS